MPPKGLVTRFQRMVRPTVPAFSVAPMTATVLGEKKTSSGWVPSLMALRAGFVSCIFRSITCLGAERGLVEGIDHVHGW